MQTIKKIIAAAALLAVCGAAAAQGDARVKLDIQPQPIRAALQEFGAQAGLQVVFKAEDVAKDGVTSPRVVGQLSPQEALEKLLANTELKFEFVNPRTVRIVGRKAQASANEGAKIRVVQVRPAESAASAPMNSPAKHEAPPGDSADTPAEDIKGIPEILVKGNRSINADIRRTEDDVQPYVVFDAEDIKRSMSQSLDDFLRTRLPMNQSAGPLDSDSITIRGGQSSIDLRGLGTDETLVLVDGRRMPGVTAGFGGAGQPDVNGIPLSAIERIEILPATAGGIYGGGATGGVVNIILKRDTNSVTMTARYDDSFEGGGAERRLDGTGGFTFGKTSLTISASYRDGNPLYVGERDFAARARQLQYRNNPAAFLSSTTPISGRTTNIRSENVGGVAPNLVLASTGQSLGSPIAYVPEGYAGTDNGLAFLQTAGRYNLDLAEGHQGNLDTLRAVPTMKSLVFSVRHEFTDRISAFLDASHLGNESYRRGNAPFGNQGFLQNNVTLQPRSINPNSPNPFTTPIRITFPLIGYSTETTLSETITERAGGGVIVRLPRQWVVQAEYNVGKTEFDSSYRQGSATGVAGAPAFFSVLSPAGYLAMQNGTLNPLRDMNVYPLDFSAYAQSEGQANVNEARSPTELENGTLRISGPLVDLPGGSLRLAAMLDRREEFTGELVTSAYQAGVLVYNYTAPTGYTATSKYVELTAPLFSAANARRGIEGLDLMASYRRDDATARTQDIFSQGVTLPNLVPFDEVQFPPYVEKSSQADQFTVGLRYSPVESVALRISYGEGVLPPSPGQLAEGIHPVLLAQLPIVAANVDDPKRGGTDLDVTQVINGGIYTTNGSLLLRPEQSASWSGGLILMPSILPRLRLSVDYTRIEKTDEIGSIGLQALLNQEDMFPGYIVRLPLTSADAALGYTGGLIRELRNSSVNIAKARVEAFDIQADYRWDTRFGLFSANVIGTLQAELTRQTAAGQPQLNYVSTRNGPRKWRVNAGLRWTRGNLDLGWDMQYIDSFLVYDATASPNSRSTSILNLTGLTAAQGGNPWLPSQDYHDVSARYRFEGTGAGRIGGLLENSVLQLSVKNVLNSGPIILPTTNSNAVAGYVTDANPLLRRYGISFEKQF